MYHRRRHSRLPALQDYRTGTYGPEPPRSARTPRPQLLETNDQLNEPLTSNSSLMLCDERCHSEQTAP